MNQAETVLPILSLFDRLYQKNTEGNKPVELLTIDTIATLQDVEPIIKEYSQKFADYDDAIFSKITHCKIINSANLMACEKIAAAIKNATTLGAGLVDYINKWAENSSTLIALVIRLYNQIEIIISDKRKKIEEMKVILKMFEMINNIHAREELLKDPIFDQINRDYSVCLQYQHYPTNYLTQMSACNQEVINALNRLDTADKVKKHIVDLEQALSSVAVKLHIEDNKLTSLLKGPAIVSVNSNGADSNSKKSAVIIDEESNQYIAPSTTVAADTCDSYKSTELTKISKLAPYMFIVNQTISDAILPPSEYAPGFSDFIGASKSAPITYIDFVRHNPHCEQIIQSAIPIIKYLEPQMSLTHCPTWIPANHKAYNPTRCVSINVQSDKCSTVNNVIRAKLMLFMNFILDNTLMYEYANIVIINTSTDISHIRVLARYFPNRNFYVVAASSDTDAQSRGSESGTGSINGEAATTVIAPNLEICKYTYTQFHERGIISIFDTNLPNSRITSPKGNNSRGGNLQTAYLISDIELDAYILNELRAEAALLRVNIVTGTRSTLSYNVQLAPWCRALQMSYIATSRSSYINSVYVCSKDIKFRDSIVEELNYIDEVARTGYHVFSPRLSNKICADLEGWYDHCRDCVAEMNILVKYIERIVMKNSPGLVAQSSAPVTSSAPIAAKKKKNVSQSAADVASASVDVKVADMSPITSSTPIILLSMNINYLLNSLKESRGYLEESVLSTHWSQRLSTIESGTTPALLVRNLTSTPKLVNGWKPNPMTAINFVNSIRL